MNTTGVAESAPSDRAAVWDEAQARQWEFDFDLETDFLAVRAQNPMPYSFDSDGCSVPPAVSWATAYDARFLSACKRHDFGYQNFGRRLHIDQTAATQDAINAKFLADMYATCASNPEWNQTQCRDRAEMFRSMVVRHADDGFNSNEEWSWSENYDNPELLPPGS